jgi:hypothetical protein
LAIDPAPTVFAGLEAFDSPGALPVALVALPKARAALPNAPDEVSAVFGTVGAASCEIPVGCPTHEDSPKVAATMTNAATDASQGNAGSAAKRGILRSNGSSKMTPASVVSIPAKNQNNGIQEFLFGCSIRPDQSLNRGARLCNLKYLNAERSVQYTVCGMRHFCGMRRVTILTEY